MAATGHPHDENTILIHFLNGLGEEYKMLKTMLTYQGTAMQWEEGMPMLYPVENECSTAASAKEWPYVGAYAAQHDPEWPRDTPMPREERRRRVVCWTCGTRGHYQRDCTKGSSDHPGTGGGPSAAFMAGGTLTNGKRPSLKPEKKASEEIPVAVPPQPTPQASALASLAEGTSKTPTRITWMIDSGAKNHMHICRVGFNTHTSVASEVTIASGHSVPSPGHGSVTRSTSLGGTVSLGRALYVPDITTNLVSVRAMAKRGKVTFEGDDVTIEQDGRVLATGRVDTNEQYMLSSSTAETVTFSAQQQATNVSAAIAYGRGGDVGHLRHRSLGHRGQANVAKVSKLVTGMTIKPSEMAPTESAPCVPCVRARPVHSPHGNGRTDTVKLKKIHVDVVGPLDPSEGGAVHFK